MTNDFTIRELQNAINRRLEKYDGKKIEEPAAGMPPYHKWYAEEIEAELREREISGLRASVWKIVADFGGPGPLSVSFEEIASVNLNMTRDKRYKYQTRGVVESLRVEFKEELLDLTIGGLVTHLLKAEKQKRIKYHTDEREKLLAAIAEADRKIAELEAVEIEEAIGE